MGDRSPKIDRLFLAKIPRGASLRRMGDQFGRSFRVTTWGESHGIGVGVVIDGCPPGLPLSEANIQQELDRRRPGQSHLTTQRKEADRANILSGVFQGHTTGSAISIMVANQDARSKDYSEFKDVFRPSHADFSYEKRYGRRDWRGGGRASARETVGRVAAGAVAKCLLETLFHCKTLAYVLQIHSIQASIDPLVVNAEAIEASLVRCPESNASRKMIECIEAVRKAGDSVGGVIEAVVHNIPAGLGDPVFDKLTADLAKALMSLPATRGVEFGLGFRAAALKGSEHNDVFTASAGRVHPASNRSGGIQGGISNGEPILLRVAFKPTATIAHAQQTVDRWGNRIGLRGKGRHDPCVLPRAVPMVEAMVCLTLADHALRLVNAMDVKILAKWMAQRADD